MEFEQLLELIDKVSGSELTDFLFEQEGTTIRLNKKCKYVKQAGEVQTVLMQETKPALPDTKKEEASGNEIVSPLVGVFYRSPSEDGEPFVQVGDHVTKGQPLAIIEAMKLMNEIEAETEGTITAILAENGQMVEYGQPLFLIEEGK